MVTKSEKKRQRTLIRIFGLLWLISFIAGGIARYLYDVNGEPDWLNALIGIFLGLAVCSASLTAIVSVFTYFWDTQSYDDKVKVIFTVIVGIPLFILGVITLWRGLSLLYNGFR